MIMEEATASRTTWPPLSKTSRVDQDNMKGSQEAPIDLDDDISSGYGITSDMSQTVEKYEITTDRPECSPALSGPFGASDDPIDTNFDTREHRTFAIRKIHLDESKKYISAAGIRVNKCVLNIETISPLQKKRLIHVTGTNAKNLFEWFL